MSMIDPQAQHELQATLDEIRRVIENLLITGLTFASSSILSNFQRAFEQAAKCKLMRLSSNLRLVTEELKRFFNDDKRFSEKRFALFLNRCWLMCKDIASINNGNGNGNNKLKLYSGAQSVTDAEKIRVIALGVVKKTAPEVFCALEFRLRNIDTPTAKPLLWSCLLATPPGSKITPEIMLQLEQPQKFKPEILLNSVVTFQHVKLTEDDAALRIQLNKESVVSADKTALETIDITALHQWSAENAIERLQAYTPSPLDLESQPQEEIYLENALLGTHFSHPYFPKKALFPLQSRGVTLHLIIDKNSDGERQMAYLKKHQNRELSAPLFGLLHYEQGLALVQPLTLWTTNNNAKHLMLSNDKTDYAALLKALN